MVRGEKKIVLRDTNCHFERKDVLSCYFFLVYEGMPRTLKEVSSRVGALCGEIQGTNGILLYIDFLNSPLQSLLRRYFIPLFPIKIWSQRLWPIKKRKRLAKMGSQR